ncbi:hypothetical protein MMC31_005548 [Peltigera leucophlebia]|nr:hypothetical protein [Peltigera leucophlebia]
MRPTVIWATVVLFAVIVALKLRSKVSGYVKPLTRVKQNERHTDLISSSNHSQPDDCSLRAALPESVTRSDADSIDRADWVLRMTHHVFSERHQGTHNVIVINDKLKYKFYAKGILERFLVNYHNKNIAGSVPYAVVVFREGTFLNLGDGGDINWDWQGNFMRSGDKLLAFKPCVPGVGYKQDPWVAT